MNNLNTVLNSQYFTIDCPVFSEYSSPIMFGGQLLLSFLTTVACLVVVPIHAFVDSESRIVGGVNVTGNGSPYLVSIRLAGKDFHCNGVLISTREVLTAAQCVYNGNAVRKINEFQLVLGTLANSNSSAGSTVRSVWNVWPHNDYNPTTRINDLAVLRLNATVPISATLSPVGFGAASPVVNRTCTLFGWGANATTGRPANTLQRINLQVQSSTSAHCVRAAGGVPLRDGMLCAGDLTAGRGACTGDLGAPLICDGSLFGVLSMTGGCGGLNETSIFIDTTRYLSWIQNRTQQAVVPPPNENGSGTGTRSALELGLLVLSVLYTLVIMK
ncbi:trypsin beta-like [Topomyia yanbarensis]|uniref:trypsin beta-like n=1 Tax=Topomyia yanbarensis TaxID=2498891 RepID=UPI00273B5B9F|nr:trypsin beta-like [Topomyia yanbarensis]